MLETLLSHGGDPNAAVQRTGENALQSAIERRNRWNVELLLEAGVRVDQPDAKGWTALDHAIAQLEYRAALDLLAAGANPRLGYAGGEFLWSCLMVEVDYKPVPRQLRSKVIADLKSRGFPLEWKRRSAP